MDEWFYRFGRAHAFVMLELIDGVETNDLGELRKLAAWRRSYQIELANLRRIRREMERWKNKA